MFPYTFAKQINIERLFFILKIFDSCSFPEYTDGSIPIKTANLEVVVEVDGDGELFSAAGKHLERVRH
jgi:hypothetical protein